MNMTPERWKVVEEIFAAAKELRPAEAVSFLREKCGSDWELEREVASLLEYHRASVGSPGALLDASKPSALLPVPRALHSGDKLGPYEIVARIGEGGMGEVYKARDTRLDRIVAIKIAKEQFTERFGREARFVAALNHPHICQIHDVGPDYVVFEYIDGAPLKGPVPPAEALRVGEQIAEALEDAHSHGIIHRDLKPANILLTTRGVKVLDFGLAKQSSAELGPDDVTAIDLTHAGEVMGTPAYMAPEQLQGKPADARTDIYAFGCVLYELLAGSRPGRERAPLKQAAIEAIVRKCLAEDPDRRFQSAAELRMALAAGAARGRGRLKYAVAAVVLIAVAAGAAMFWQQRAHSRPKLTDRDVLIVADFDNKTNDPVFDTALKQALAFQLQESPFLKAMDEEEIRDTLKRSGRAPDAHVTAEIARDICIRESQKATLDGSIVAIGSRYLIALQAVNCQTGETFAREQAEAADKEHVVEALSRATSSMRAKLGESLATIQGENRAYPQAVTTSSLEALRAFYMADEGWTRTLDARAAIPLYRRATELDPNFALAFAILGYRYGASEAAKEATEKAWSLKDRVSERERLFIEWEYYSKRGDARKARDAAELLARRYPRDSIFHGNLAIDYLIAGEPEKSLSEAQAAIRNNPRILQGYVVASEALADLDRLHDSKAMLLKALANGFDGLSVHYRLLEVGYVGSDAPTQQRETQWIASHEGEAYVLAVQANNAAARGHVKQAGELFREGVDSARQHPSGFGSQEILADETITDALIGKCAPRGSKGVASIVMAICGPMAAKKFIEQQAANARSPESEASGSRAYVRGLALLADGQGEGAATVFSLMVNRKVTNWGPEYAAAQIGLARAAKLMGDTARARRTYEQFFAFWKDADPDIPLLVQARKEYAALK